jgi:hypothetical protein
MAVALCGLYVLHGPAASRTNLTVGLLCLIPLWIAASSLAFVGAAAKPAYAWLVALNLVCYSALYMTQPVAM